jgi:PAS domain S-box-containing protein
MVDVLPKDVFDKYDEVFQHASGTYSPSVIRYSLEINGGERHYEARILPFGKEFIIVERNITVETIAERSLVDRLGELESIYENTPIGLSYVDSDLRYLRINKHLADLNGKSVSEHIGRTVSEIVPEIKDIVVPLYKKVIASGLPVLDKELSGKTIANPDNIHHWLASFFPLKSDSGSVQGVISVVRDITAQKYVEKQFAEYRTQLKNLASQLTLAEERERHRVAIGLHDQIGQPLAMAKIKLQMLLKYGFSAQTQKEIQDICDLLSSALEDSRSLTFDLSSPVLYELGLEAAVASWLKNEVETKNDIKTEFFDDGNTKSLNDDIRRLLFRNVRELLANVIKHGQANKVKVEIKKANNNIEISVEDDGVGFDSAKKVRDLSNHKGYGLFSIREQLEHLGGHIEIDSAFGKGCKVKLTAPLKIEKKS